jgi:hypothetical protein
MHAQVAANLLLSLPSTAASHMRRPAAGACCTHATQAGRSATGTLVLVHVVQGWLPMAVMSTF